MSQISVDKLYKEALELPDESKISLAERLVAYLETHIDPELEKVHLEVANNRRDELLSGNVTPIDGKKALDQARQRLKK